MSLLFLCLKENASSDFVARPHGKESEGQGWQDTESHADASFPLLSFAELLVLPRAADYEALPASADMVSVGNRRNH